MQHSTVLDILVHSRRNKSAAKKFFRKFGYPSGEDCQRPGGTRPRVLITDKLGSYAAA